MAQRKRSEFLSPSCINQFYYSLEDFYRNYILRRPRMKQTPAQGLGSAFDAHVKWEIRNRLGKENVVFPFRSFKHCYESQVAKHLNLMEPSEKIFRGYVDSGMFDRIMEHPNHGKLIKCTMEVLVTADVDGVIVGGYPDFLGLYEDNTRIILDWKVNGYYSARRVSTGKGPVYVCGDTTGREKLLSETDYNSTGWGVQLGIYNLCTNIRIGMIHQFAFNGIDSCRYAEFYGKISTDGLDEKIKRVNEQLHAFTALDEDEKRFVELMG